MPLYGTQQMGIYQSSDEDEDSNLESGSEEEEEEEALTVSVKQSPSEDEQSDQEDSSSERSSHSDQKSDQEMDDFQEAQPNSIDEIFPDVSENSEDSSEFGSLMEDFEANSESEDDVKSVFSEESYGQPNPLPQSVKFQFSPSTNGCLPHIMYFPKAPPPPESLNPDKKSKSKDPLKIKVLRSKDTRRATQRVVLAETARMEYVGTNFGREGRDINRYMIGVYDKERKKIKLVDSSHIFSMQQTIKSYEEKEEDTSMGDWRQANRTLVETFGSKRARTDLNKAIRDQVTEDNINADTVGYLNKTISNKLNVTPTLESLQSEARGDLPPFDLHAKRVEGVYKTTDVIFEELREELYKIAKTELLTKSVQQLQEKVLDETPEGYPKSCLFHLSNFPDGPKKEDVGCFILFLIYLIRFYKYFGRSAMNIKAGAQKTNIPVSVFYYLTDLFASKASEPGSNRIRFVHSEQQRTKLTNYILIVHLILSGYKMNVTQISKDLKIDDRKMKFHCRAIGCTTTGGRKTITTRRGVNAIDAEIAPELFAELTVPLSFGDPERARGGKRRN